MRCEDEKMFDRPPLLEEPCAQTLSGKKEMIQMSIYFPPNPYCQTKASWREDLSRVAHESPGALTTPMRQCVGIPDHVFQYYVTASCGKLKHKPPPHVAY